MLSLEGLDAFLGAGSLLGEASHPAAIVGPAFGAGVPVFPTPGRFPRRQGVPRAASKDPTPTKGEGKKEKKKKLEEA